MCRQNLIHDDDFVNHSAIQNTDVRFWWFIRILTMAYTVIIVFNCPLSSIFLFYFISFFRLLFAPIKYTHTHNSLCRFTFTHVNRLLTNLKSLPCDFRKKSESPIRLFSLPFLVQVWIVYCSLYRHNQL